MQIDVYTRGREKVGALDLADDVFGVEVTEHRLYAVVRYQRNAARQGTHYIREDPDLAITQCRGSVLHCPHYVILLIARTLSVRSSHRQQRSFAR